MDEMHASDREISLLVSNSLKLIYTVCEIYFEIKSVNEEGAYRYR